MRYLQPNLGLGSLAAGCLRLTRKPLLALSSACALLAALSAAPAFAQTADLAVTKAGAPLTVGTGANITYTLSVTNAGPNDGSAVTLTDVLPPGVTFVSGSAGCTESLGVVTCVVGALVANTSAGASIIVTATSCDAQLTNVVSVAATEIDPNLLDNTNSAVNAVIDMTAPVIGACPANITGNTDAGLCAKTNVTWIDPTATDNCTLSPAVVCVPASGSTFNTGATIVTCTATDAVGLTNACTFTVTISDTEAPVIGACPVNITGNTDLGVCTKANVMWTVPGATDNCPGVLVACSPASGSTFAKGATIVTCTATDAVGLTNACTFTVTISDTQAPTIACPANLTTNLTAGCTTPVTFTNPVVTDNCPGATFVCVPANGSTFSLGATTVTCTPTDASLNVGAICTFTVTVTAAAPSISAQPQNQITPMGNGVVFSVTAAGTATLTYQWRSNGVPISGATASSLAISNLNLASSGSFAVVVANCAGSLTSASATLTVTPIYGLSFDFDTAGQYTNMPYYLTWNNWVNSSFVLPPVAMFESPLGGVGPFPGSGSLDMIPNNASDNTSVLLAGSYDFSLPGKTLFASTMFKFKTPVAAGRRATQFGFLTQTNLGLSDQVPQSFMTVILQTPTAAANTLEFRTQRRSSGGGLQESVFTQATGLTVSNWYRLTVGFTNTANLVVSNFSIFGVLQDMGPLGTTPGATVLTMSSTTNTADMVQMKNVYLALRSFEDGGVDIRDNTYVWTTPGNLAFVQQPKNLTLAQGGRGTFNAMVDGDGPYTYQWQKSTDGGATFSPISGARDWKYIVPAALTTDTLSQYRVTVVGPANTVTSTPATLTVTPLTLAVVSAGSVDGTTVGVLFNQPVQPASAENVANYTINGVNPVAARVYRTSLSAVGPEGVYVILTPASILSGSFTVVASGVQNLSGGVVGGANSAVGSVANLTGVDVNPITAPAGENYSFGPGQFIVTGGGTDIFSGFDGFRYVYTTRTGDFDLRFRIPFMDSVRFTEKGGVDARMSLEPGSPGVFAGFNPGPIGELAGALRSFTEGTAKPSFGAGGQSWGNNTRLLQPNAWMRFRRAGNSFLRYSSSDGVTWSLDGQFSQSLITPFPPTMLVGLAVTSARNTQPASVQFESFGEFAGYPGATIAISAQPMSATNAAGTAASITNLTATVTGGGIPAQGEIAVLWQRFDGVGWTNMPTAGGTNRVLSIGTVFGSDNGAQYRAILMAPGVAPVTTAVATLTVTDTALPTVASVGVGAVGVLPSYPVSEIVITFSEPVTAATATLLANYAVTNAAGVKLTVLSASFLGLDPRVIVLRVSGQLGTGDSSVGISGIRDLNNNLLASVVRTSRSFAPSVAPVVIEVYQDIGNGTIVDNLTGNAIFTAGTPTYITYSNLFGFNVVAAFGSSQDNYGTKGYTYFVPPTNGNYKFWIRNDDHAALFINPTGTNPLGKILIASNAAANAVYSVGTLAGLATNHTLVANQRYYMEVLHKEGTGGDGWSVMWTDAASNAAPANTIFIPTANLAYPDAVAPRTPVITELYTGYNNFIPGFNQLAGLYAATNFPANNYQLQTVNFNYIAGLPAAVVYQKYFGVQPALGNTRFDNYLGKAYSYFVAPSNGQYRFYCAVDDICQLWMNTNAVNSIDPAGKQLIGQSANAFLSTASQLMGQNISLVGGQKYYTEVLYREGGGGDGIRLSVRSQGDAAVPPLTEIIQNNLLEYPVEIGRAGAVGFTHIASSAPQSVDGLTTTVTAGETLTLLPAGIRGSLPYGGFVWTKNGVRILENSFTNYTMPLTLADHGAVFSVQVTNFFSSMTRSIMVNVLADGVAPTVARTVGWRYADGFTIQFSEPMDALTAGYLGNYQVNNGLRLLSATLDQSRTMLSVRTTTQAPDTIYTVTINGAKDRSTANTIAANTMVNFSTWKIGGNGILVELFTNIQGGAVADLTGTTKFQANLPDVIYYTNVFGAGLFNANSLLENYGARISGYFIPTNTGLYRFYIRGDDGCQLWMNINNADSQNPAGRTMLIHTPTANININNPNAMSAPVSLNQGQAYYMEGLMKEGGGGDYFQMTFRPTDASGTVVGAVPIDNTVNENTFNAFFGGVPGDPSLVGTVTGPPADLFVTENDLVTLTVNASIPPSLALASSYQWQRKPNGAGSFTNIPGASQASFSFYVPLADELAQYRVLFSAPGANTNFVTTLHVTNDITPPYLAAVGSVDGLSIGICFSELVDTNNGGDFFSYIVNGGLVNVTGVEIRPDGRTYRLFLDAPVTTPFTVDAFGIPDRASVANVGDSTAMGRLERFTPLDVGATPGPGNSFSCNTNEIDVIAGGADIWTASDQGHMTLRPITGNFDVWARLKSLSRAPGDNDGITKAGIMVRESFNADARKLQYLAEPPVSFGGRDIYEAGQRPTTAAATAAWAGGNGNTGIPAGIPNTWIRIKRTDNLFSAFRSTNGMDWTLTTTQIFVLPSTLLVGLGTTAHVPNPSAATTLAEYRNIHIPQPPSFLVNLTPPSQSVPLHSPVNFNVTASNVPDGGPLVYKWYRNGIAIPGATSSTYSLSDAMVADGGIYTVTAGNDGGVVTSDPSLLTVLNGLPVVGTDMIMATQGMAFTFPAGGLTTNDTDPEANALNLIAVSGIYPVTYAANFDDGLNPTNATLFGSVISPSGGANNTGYLKLNDSTAGAVGSFILNNLTPGRRVQSFSASFLLRIGDGSAEPADGFSFNFGRDVTLAAASALAAENGSGTGFSFCVDNYRFAPLSIGAAAGAPGGGNANTSGLKINYGNVIIAGVQLPAAWNSPRFVPVTIDVSAAGQAVVTVDGTNVFGTLTLPGYSPISGQFAMYGRTGGQTETHWIDDLSITALTLETTREIAPPNLGGGVLYGSAYVTNGNGTVNSGSLHLTDNINGQAGSLVLTEVTPGKAVAAFSASFDLRIGNGTGNAADGFSFNLANDLPLAASPLSGAAEEGAGTGLSLCIDNYPTGGPDSPSFKLKLGGVQIGLVLIPKWNTNTYIPVGVLLTNNQLTVSVSGTNVVASLPIPYSPIAGRFGFYARTGGENETHWMDNLTINVTAVDSTTGSYAANFDNLIGTNGTVTLAGGQITYTPPVGLCGTDTFYYLVSDGQQGGVSIGQVDVVIKEAVPASPVITTCPPNRSIIITTNCQPLLADLRGELVATDNCCCLTVTQSPLPGTPLNIGATLVTFTVTDTGGLSTNCTTVVRVVDQTAPVILCSANLTAECVTPLGVVVSYSASASDFCDAAPTVMCSPASGSVFPIGVTTVRCVAYDVSLNTNTCSFTVTVNDTTGPVFVCPANIVVRLTNQCTATVNFPPVLLTDCDTNAVYVFTPASGSIFYAGTNIVTVTAYDTFGNTNRCSFIVAVSEDVKPSIVCPPDLIVDCGNSTVPPATGTASATDNCDTNVTLTYVDGSTVEVLSTSLAGWVFSTVGSPLTSSAGFTAGPALPPLGSGSLRLAIGSDGDNVAQARNTNYHNVPLNSISELGFRTYRAAGGASQSIYVILNVDLDGDGMVDDLLYFEPRYQDGDNPMLPNQGTLATATWQSWNAMIGGWSSLNYPGVMSAGPGVQPLAAYVAGFPTAKIVNTTSGAGGVRLVAGLGLGGWANFDGSVDQVTIGVNGVSAVNDFDDAAGNDPLVSQIVRTWTARDDSGNLISCSQVIKVRDITAPVINCSSNLVVECSAPGGATVTYVTTANDACEGAITPVCLPASGSFFAMGVTTVNCSAADSRGYSNSCSFTITVRDTTAPAIVCSINRIVECTGGLGTPVSYLTTTTDVCDTNVMVICTPAPGSLFPLGTTTVGCSVSDVSGNSNGCSFTVTVQDTTPPVIACSSNLIVQCTSPAGAMATYVTTATDACDTVPSLVCSPVSGSLFTPGLTTVRCLATDATSNSNACSFTITVVDTTAPTIVCSTNIAVECTSPAGAVATYVVTTSDICDTNPVLVCSPLSGSLFPPGATTVNCVSTDANSNSNACSFTVTVRDTTPPSITCPANRVVECGTPAGTPVTFTVTASDICDTSPVITSTPPSGSTFPPGVTTVTNVARDASGNSNVCTFTVTVQDTTPPVRCANPPVIVMGGVNDNFIGVEAASPSVNLQARLSSRDLRNFDEAVADGWLGHSFAGLPSYIAEAKLRIKLRADLGVPENDTIQLLFTGPGGSAQPQEWNRRIGSGFDATPGLLPTSWSLGAETELVLDLGRLTNANASVTDLLPQLRNLRFLDVIVQDDTLVDYVVLELTICQCQPDIAVNKDPMACGANVAFPLPPFADNCDPNPSVVCVPASGSFFAVGTTLVVCTATDASGNRAVCTFNVTVQDTPAALSIALSGANVIISWPTPCTPGVLEETGSLNPPILWSPVGAPVVIVGPLSQVTLPATGQHRYFRLRQ